MAKSHRLSTSFMVEAHKDYASYLLQTLLAVDPDDSDRVLGVVALVEQLICASVNQLKADLIASN